MKKKTQEGDLRIPRYGWGLIVLFLIGSMALLFRWYLGYNFQDYLLSNTNFTEEYRFAKIKPGSSAKEVGMLLERQGIVKNGKAVTRYLQRGQMRKDGLFSGRYRVSRGSTTHQISRMISSHRQTPVMLVVPTVRTLEELCGRICSQIALDSGELLAALHSHTVAEGYQLTVATLPTIIIPNSYEVYWDVSLKGLLDRLHLESERFWKGERAETARGINFTPEQVYTLASIIQEEVMRPKELPIIAGVYMNRLAKGMLLSACPTAKYAAGNLGLSRVLTVHTTIESEYNTYIHHGLPPGPIRITSIEAIDAVLHYTRHNYLYFCAKSDFSGYHHFSTTGEEHMQYAREYRRALNRRLREQGK